MLQSIRKLGLTRSVIFLSFISGCFSMAVSYLVSYFLMKSGFKLNLITGLIISMIISLTITPLMSFYLVRLFFEVDRLEEEMRFLSTHDSLTGLLTRREFHERVNYFHNIAQRENLTYSLIVADLENFNEINDQFGHQIGDQTLESLGLAIQDTLRDSDLACHYGGDEFTFFLPNTDTTQAKSFCERLQTIIQESITCSSPNIVLTASIGIASYPENNADFLDDMIKQADSAMYEVKITGDNQSGLIGTSSYMQI